MLLLCLVQFDIDLRFQILRVGRKTLDKSNPKECKVVVKNANYEDDGTWHFQVGYGNNREEMQWYQHNVVVQVKSRLPFQNLLVFEKV